MMSAPASPPVAAALEVFGEVPRDFRIPTFDVGARTSRYMTSAGGLAEFDGQVDVFMACALVTSATARAVGRRGRPKAEHAAAIGGFSVDLDVNGTPDGRGGVKVGAAPTREAALQAASA